MRRFSIKSLSLALATTMVAVLATASVASAAVNPGKFNLNFTTAKVILGDTATLDVPGNDPALAGKTITVNANVDANGKIDAYRDALTFPTIPLEVSTIQLGIGIIQTAKSSGTINSATNAVSMPLNLGIRIDASAIGVEPCVVPVPFVFDTGSHPVTATKTVTGSAYNPATGALTLAAVGQIPATITPSAGCPPDSASLLSTLLGQVLGGGSAPKVGIELAGTLTMPGGARYLDPDAPLPPSLASTKLSVKGGSAAATVKCGAPNAKGGACVGKATLSFKAKGKKTETKIVVVPYSVAAGKSAVVKMKISASTLKALKGVGGKATLRLAPSTGAPISKAVTVK